jgi:hypothetical protein
MLSPPLLPASAGSLWSSHNIRDTLYIQRIRRRCAWPYSVFLVQPKSITRAIVELLTLNRFLSPEAFLFHTVSHSSSLNAQVLACQSTHMHAKQPPIASFRSAFPRPGHGGFLISCPKTEIISLLLSLRCLQAKCLLQGCTVAECLPNMQAAEAGNLCRDRRHSQAFAWVGGLVRFCIRSVADDQKNLKRQCDAVQTWSRPTGHVHVIAV